MYCNFIEENYLNKFVSIYFDYDDETQKNLLVKIKQKTDYQIVADVLLKDNKDKTFSYLGQLTVDDFTCMFKIFQQNEINKKILKYNGNYPNLFYSKNWRIFLASAIEKKYGQDKAEDYAEDFLATNLGNVKEYEKLMQIAYCRASELYEPYDKGKGKEE